MIPYESLRTNHLFSNAPNSGFDGSGNPLGINPVQHGTPNGPDWITTRVLQANDARQAHQQMIMDAAKQTTDQRAYEEFQRGRNVNIAPEAINPLAGAKLQMQAEAEKGKNDRNAADVASREKLATANLAEKQQYGQGNLNIKQQMANIAEFKSKNPSVSVYAPKGGTVHLYDSIHGMVDTGISTGTMTDADRLDAEKGNQLEEIAARGDQSRQTEIQKGGNAIEQIGARGAQQRATDAAKPSTVRPQSESDKKVGYYNAAQKLITSDPTLGKYIEMGTAPNTFSIKPGTPIEVQHSINEQIYGSGDNKDFKPGVTDFTPGGNSGKIQKETSGNQDTKSSTQDEAKKKKIDDPLGLLDDAVPGDE